MATKAQIEANRRNAQKSTGPTTDAGKAKCAGNRYTHGLCSRMLILEFEKSEEFQALREDLYAEYQPVTRTEMLLVDRMVLNHWTAERALSLQSVAFAAVCNRGDVPLSVVGTDLNLLLRYHQAGEKGFDKARRELLSIQKERKNSEIGSESQISVEPPVEAGTADQQTSPPAPRVAPIPDLNPPDLNLPDLTPPDLNPNQDQFLTNAA